MKRKLFSVLLCLILLGSLLTTAYASESDAPKVVDQAELLASWEIEALTEKANALIDEYDMDVVILTVWSLDGKSSQDYADDYYDQNGYGVGSDYSGVLFLLAMESRQWYISTCGDAIHALTDYGIESIGEDVTWYLSDGDYYDGFDTFLNLLDVYFDAYRSGAPIDGYVGSYDGPGSYSPGEAEDTVYYDDSDFGFQNILLALVIGLAAGGITIWVMISGMNTKRQQHGAGVYVRSGSYYLRRHSDVFLYSNVSKVRRQENNSGGRSGGSSIHRSSGGRSHGGGGGRF